MIHNYTHSDMCLIKKERDGFSDVLGTGLALPSQPGLGLRGKKKHPST